MFVLMHNSNPNAYKVIILEYRIECYLVLLDTIEED